MSRQHQSGAVSGSIRADEVVLLSEFGRRFNLGQHGLRAIQKAGLLTVSFGRQKFVRGAAVADFFRQLEEEAVAERRNN